MALELLTTPVAPRQYMNMNDEFARIRHEKLFYRIENAVKLLLMHLGSSSSTQRCIKPLYAGIDGKSFETDIAKRETAIVPISHVLR